MSNPLPRGGFKWIEEEDLRNWRNVPCTVKVDLEYPKEFHDAHNEYPLAAERLVIGKVEKLIPNLNDKTKYVVNHRTLKCYKKYGMKVTKVHRGIQYQERPWMGKYISLNTNLRATAKNDFEKDFFKLMNKSVFGKNYGKREKLCEHSPSHIQTNRQQTSDKTQFQQEHNLL